MNKLLVALTVSALVTISASINAHGGNDTFDGKGNLFVADAYSGRIFKYTPDGKKSTFASGLMPDGGYDVAFDRAGNLFASDEANDLILKFTLQGKKTTFATGVRARALMFDKAGNLFVPDYDNQSIFKFTPAGKKSTFASDLSPGAVAIDSTGNLFVSDSRSNSILRFTPDGKKTTFASGLSPLELAFDSSGNLFAADYYSHSIVKFAPDGTKSIFAADLTPDSVYDIAVEGANNLFVLDRGSKTIFKFAPNGTKSTFAIGDFEGPTFDKAGNLYVRESGSILKFAPDGSRSTFAASGRISPDKKWEYVSGDEPKIVKAGTNELALDLSDQPGGNGFGSAKVIWAPDSKRFAFNYGQGREHATSLYQLRGDEWKGLESPDDKVSDAADKAVAAQLKRDGLSKKKLSKEKKYLRLISWTPKVINWEDSNTADLYASLQQVVALRDDPGEMFDGFGADLLFTLKFDQAGHWKIIRTHQMSKRELEAEEQ